MINEQIISSLGEQIDKLNMCFAFKFKMGKEIYLTNCQDVVHIEGISFYPFSDIELESLASEQNGYMKCIIKGYFDESGIVKEDDFDGCELCVYLYCLKDNLYQKWYELYCVNSAKKDKKFTLEFSSLIGKLAADLTQIYSTNCRVDLGDARCGVDKSKYKNPICDKSLRMCCNKYNNAVNFRGEPFIPTIGYFNKHEDK